MPPVNALVTRFGRPGEVSPIRWSSRPKSCLALPDPNLSPGELQGAPALVLGTGLSLSIEREIDTPSPRTGALGPWSKGIHRLTRGLGGYYRVRPTCTGRPPARDAAPESWSRRPAQPSTAGSAGRWSGRTDRTPR